MNRLTPILVSLGFLILAGSCGSGNKSLPSTGLNPNELFYALRNYPDFDAAAAGFRQAKDLAHAGFQNRGDAPPGFDVPWENVGPNNIGGRVNTLLRHPLDTNLILAGLTAGGIFRSTDAGATWYPVFDDQPVLSISFLVVDPVHPEVVYAGTGDPNISSYVFLGQGLYRSTDFGETWTDLGLENAGVLSAMQVHPLHTDTLFVASMGIPLRRGEERGLYRSVNGGDSWEKVLTLSDEAGITDLLICPDDPDVILATGWHRVRNQAESVVNGDLARLYRSEDGGDTWTTILNGLPDEKLSRSGLSWSSGQAFVMFVGTDQQLRGIYRSDDLGLSWVPVPTDKDANGLSGNALGGFGWYFGKIVADPNDPNDLFLLGVDLWRTRDGGQTWSSATPPWWVYDVHADKHDLRFHPDGMIDLATDGGAYTTRDDAETWTDLDMYPATQFYRIALNPHDPGEWTGGAQDNGTVTGWTDPSQWFRIYGGDGFQAAFHPDWPDLIYAEWQNGSMVVSANGGADWDDFTSGIDPNDRVGWDAPYFISSHPPHAMYHGTNRVYKNEDPFFANWLPISGKLTATPELFHPGTHVITALGEDGFFPGALYAGAGDGSLWFSPDDGQSWLSIADGLPARYVTRVQGSPTQAGGVFVSHSGYRYNEFLPHLHRSTDFGKTWVSLDGDLPPLAINTFVVIPGTGDSVILVGTDAGVYATVEAGTSWFPFGEGMPSVPIYDMAFQEETHTLVVATHARSMYKASLDDLLNGLNTAQSWTDNRKDFWEVRGVPVGKDLILAGRFSTEGSSARLDLLDIQGRSVIPAQAITFGANEVGRISLPSLPTGVYYVRIISEGNLTVIPVVIDQSGS